jgi:nicotinamidase/pyrazinamidase
VAGTPGAELHPELRRDLVQHLVSKGTAPGAEAYSGFQGTGLAALLRQAGIRRLFVCGLATDYCVRATALDARREGFDVVVLADAVRGVEVQPGDCDRALREMQAAGVRQATSNEVTLATSQ